MSWPRRLLALCSPRTHLMASTTLDLPEPFGPTTTVMPAGNSNRVLSAKLLKPYSSRAFNMTGGGPQRPSYKRHHFHKLQLDRNQSIILPRTPLFARSEPESTDSPPRSLVISVSASRAASSPVAVSNGSSAW